MFYEIDVIFFFFFSNGVYQNRCQVSDHQIILSINFHSIIRSIFVYFLRVVKWTENCCGIYFVLISTYQNVRVLSKDDILLLLHFSSHAVKLNIAKSKNMLKRKKKRLTGFYVFSKSSPFFHSCLNRHLETKTTRPENWTELCEMRALPRWLSFSVYEYLCDHRFENHVYIEKYFHSFYLWWKK